MTGSVFVDTNVLVYAYDRSEPEKQAQALQVLDRLALSGAGVLSTQVLSEFFVTVTRKLPAPLTPDEAYARITEHLQSWTILDLAAMVVLEAIRGVHEHQFSYWDAQIWSVARLNQVEVVFSEDFHTDSVIEGVRFVDPFADDFQLAEWVI
jgi:predicted nucleic acid-binding protein